GAVGHQPQRLGQEFQPVGQPVDQPGGHRQLGLEAHAIALLQQGNPAPADVEQGAQGQGEGAPEGVADNPGEGAPDVAVDQLLVGRAGGRVVVDAGPLDLLAVAPGRRVVQREQQPALGGEQGHGAAEQQGGEQFALAAQGAQEVIVGLVVVPQAGGAEPGGDGAAALGE